MTGKVKNTSRAVKSVDEKSQKWIERLSILVAIWGVLSLLFSSTVFGIIFILFAVLIRLPEVSWPYMPLELFCGF